MAWEVSFHPRGSAGEGVKNVLDRFVFFGYILTRKQVDELQTAFFCKISGANGLKT